MKKRPKNYPTKKIKEKTWRHPGGKLRELGPHSLTEAELLAILISTGIKNKSALEIATELLFKYKDVKRLANQPLADMLKFKGLSDVKIIRIAAAYELAKRLNKK